MKQFASPCVDYSIVQCQRAQRCSASSAASPPKSTGCDGLRGHDDRARLASGVAAACSRPSISGCSAMRHIVVLAEITRSGLEQRSASRPGCRAQPRKRSAGGTGDSLGERNQRTDPQATFLALLVNDSAPTRSTRLASTAQTLPITASFPAAPATPLPSPPAITSPTISQEGAPTAGPSSLLSLPPPPRRPPPAQLPPPTTLVNMQATSHSGVFLRARAMNKVSGEDAADQSGVTRTPRLLSGGGV